ncbi:ATP-binding cassette domain-containing protein [Microbacterium lacticum]|uniref:ATP-binding cassette domain-containing protein n=1 Tax=Microbacterium lacticum TaxID=33885 RepID=UPI0028D13C7C|nr:ATP-binding cassette domain-containing protein [Microbacterium lacticum]
MQRRASSEYAVQCDDLSVARGGTRVVEGMTLRLAAGRALAIMGPTGAGKSSLAALLAGADEPGLAVVGGSAAVEGIPVRARGRKQRVRTYLTGYLSQGAGGELPARLTVGEVIGEPVTSRDRRVNERALALRVAGLLDELQLPLGAAAKYPYELSSGMRQRVALARALVLNPRLFVGDDPYANLDLEVRKAARDALLRRRDEDGMAIFVVTNDVETVRDLDADVLVLRAGRPVGSGHGTADVLWTPDEGARIAS